MTEPSIGPANGDFARYIEALALEQAERMAAAEVRSGNDASGAGTGGVARPSPTPPAGVPGRASASVGASHLGRVVRTPRLFGMATAILGIGLLAFGLWKIGAIVLVLAAMSRLLSQVAVSPNSAPARHARSASHAAAPAQEARIRSKRSGGSS